MQNHVREKLIEIGKEETWQSRNFQSNETKKPTRYLVTGVWKRRKKYLACPPQIHKSGLQSQLEFGRYKNNTSISLKYTKIDTNQHWNSENTQRIPDIHTLPHSNIRFGQFPPSENRRRRRGPQTTPTRRIGRR
jgi:hypothetical protein